jgi:hypothetical protein
MSISSYPLSGLSKNAAIVYSTQPYKTNSLTLPAGIYSGKKESGEDMGFIDSDGNIKTVGTSSELVNFQKNLVSVRPLTPKLPVSSELSSPALDIVFKTSNHYFEYSTSENKAYYVRFSTGNNYSSTATFYNESTDLITWTSQRLTFNYSTTQDPGISAYDTVRGPAGWFTEARQIFYRSTDGITWSSIATTNQLLAEGGIYSYGENAPEILKLPGGDGSRRQRRSTDGITWTTLFGITPLATTEFNGTAYLNNTYIVWATNPDRVTWSTNISTWITLNASGAGGSSLEVTPVYVSFTNNAYLVTGLDGSTPSIESFPSTSFTSGMSTRVTTPFIFREIGYLNNFYFTKFSTSIYFSTNLATWTVVANTVGDTAQRYALTLLNNEGAYFMPPHKVEPNYSAEYVFLSEGKTKEIEV